MPEIGTSGSMSGDGKRGAGHWPQATAPILDSTLCPVRVVAQGGLLSRGEAVVLRQPNDHNKVKRSVFWGCSCSASAAAATRAIDTTRKTSAPQRLRQLFEELRRAQPTGSSPALDPVPSSLRQSVGEYENQLSAYDEAEPGDAAMRLSVRLDPSAAAGARTFACKRSAVDRSEHWPGARNGPPVRASANRSASLKTRPTSGLHEYRGQASSKLISTGLKLLSSMTPPSSRGSRNGHQPRTAGGARLAIEIARCGTLSRLF